MDRQKISIKFAEFDILLEIKNVKYLRLKIDKDENIKISAPLNIKKADIFDFLDKNEFWIRKTIKKINIKKEQNSLKENEIYYLGEIYKLNFNDEFSKIKIENNIISIKNKESLDKFLFQKLNEISNKYINFYLPKIGKNITKIRIKKMKTRWGSCNHNKGYINLNFNLIQKDEKFIEYVILHELTHLIYPHHQKPFYDYIENLMPDYKIRINLN